MLALAQWVQCVAGLAAASDPQLKAQVQQAGVAGRLAIKQAALAKAREGMAALQAEVLALQGEREAAALAAGVAGVALGGGGGQ
jgi:hypothetical protein